MVFYCPLRGHLLIFLIVVCELKLLILVANAQEPEYLYHYCPNTTTYNQNSTYHANLRRLFSNLSLNVTNTMFLNTTVGNNAPDVVYGLFFCRGDVTIDACRKCIGVVTTEVIQRCPKQRESYIWYDQCMLRYNNISFFGNLAISPNNVYTWNTRNMSNSDEINTILVDVMDELINRASGDVGPLKGFASGEYNFQNLYKFYNLVQCTQDLSGLDCDQCLHKAFGLRADGSRSGRVMFPSCVIRYEMYPFNDSIVSLPAPPTPPSAPVPDIVLRGKGRLPAAMIAVIVVLVTFSIVMFTICICFLRKKAKKKSNLKTEATEADTLQYDLSTIEVATNKFSPDNKIGEGGFGEVFKGCLNNGQQIAVKRLSKSSGQGEQEFKNEVTVVAKLQHRNLVRLLGYCLDEDEKILIYEYVPNKSLDFMLFDQEMQQILDWSRRYKIIGGVARGILYLHEDSRLRIIHRDIKASNVLLDNDMNSKISDFGLARIVGFDKSEGSTNRVVGTFGYMPPEYIMHGQFSVKTDVFSFGVLVLEIISGKKNNSFYQSRNSEHLLTYAWKLWKDGKSLDLVDPALGDSFNKTEVTQCIHMGLLCVQKDFDERPPMGLVVHMLNSSSMTLPIPHQPAFFVHSEMMPVSNLLDPVLWSANGVSISELHPR